MRRGLDRPTKRTTRMLAAFAVASLALTACGRDEGGDAAQEQGDAIS